MATLNPRNWFRQIFPTARRLLIERDIDHWCTDEFNRVLVIGAGHDPYKKYFKSAALYVALDVVSFSGVTDVIADAVSLPLDDNAFDCVVAFEVMEHVAEPIKLIEEAYRVLSPGGLLLLSVPFVYHQHGDPSDFWRPTRHTLEHATAKFSVSDVLLQGNRIHVISDLITTAFYPRSIFSPLRILNHIIVWPFTRWSCMRGSGTAPSGFFVVARK